MPTNTVLAITGITIPDYAIRGLTFDLQLVTSDGGLRRSVNGELLDLTASQFRKYSGTLSCQDQDVPVLTDIWEGQVVAITLIPFSGIGTATLNMMVTNWTTSTDEWGHLVDWSIDFLEI